MWGDYHDRQELLSDPFPEDWDRYLRANVAHYALLSEEERVRLQGDAHILVAEKNWEGCGGLQLTGEIKITIAAQAALLLLGIEHHYFQRVLSILVYPSGFLIPGGRWMDEADNGVAAAGQAVYRGPAILAWDAVRAEAADPSRGRNVVIHEFAHQLDYLDGEVNGTPVLPNADQEERWHDVMTGEFWKLRRRLGKGRRTFLGHYAAKSESEFFAVLTERFFTVPTRLRRYHPKIWDLLSEYYGVNPSRWFQPSSTDTEKGP
jgi:Mlc titration factor MtfA (ptsG expression regulator)